MGEREGGAGTMFVCLLNAEGLAEGEAAEIHLSVFMCVCVRVRISINLIERLLGSGTGSCKAEGMRF